MSHGLTFVKGTKGRSKKTPRLSIDTVFNTVGLHVWENDGHPTKITHTFYPDRQFLVAMRDQADAALRFLDAEEKRLAPVRTMIEKAVDELRAEDEKVSQ